MLTPYTATGFGSLVFFIVIGFRLETAGMEQVFGLTAVFTSSFIKRFAPYEPILTENVKPTVYVPAAELTPLKIVAIN